MPHSLQNLIHQHAQQRPHKPAFSFNGHSYSYAELAQQIDQLTRHLQGTGITANDKVATLLPNCLEQLLLIWATARLGAVIVPLSPLLQDQAAINLSTNAEASLLVCSDDRCNNLKLASPPSLTLQSLGLLQNALTNTSSVLPSLPNVQADDLFNIVYSSGTTGLPKGIMHTHQVRAMYGYCFATAFRIKQDSVILHSGAIIFNGAYVTMMPCYLQGGHFILAEAFHPETTLDLIRHYQVTHTMMVPSQLIAMLEHPDFSADKLASMEVLLVLGAPLHQRYKDQLEAILPGRFHELYGLTEGFITILDNSDMGSKPGSVGCPLPGSAMRIVDDQGHDLANGEIGEIVGQSPLLSPGYYGNEALTAATFKDGWLYTGDMGSMDAEGFLYLADRKKDMIISGGVNVYPKDIEEILVNHPQVIEGVVIGVADKKWGETPVAVVVARQADQEQAIQTWVNERVAARYQKLSRVYSIDEMPRNVAGKTLKNELRERFG